MARGVGRRGVVRRTGVWGRRVRAAWIEGPPDLGSPGATTRRGRKAIRKIYDIADGPHRVIGPIDAHGVNPAGES
ncbi:hypothetical protein ACFZDP_31650 [Streptomyces mirabilis]|uniref:hypothetical protein n=1 Tax=Streptomyces mirabilis TaxID=68239 RepID=UPI0036EF2BAF